MFSFSLQSAFLCPPLLGDFFLVSRLIYTSTRIQKRRDNIFMIVAWILAPIFGAFLCDFTQHCRMLIFISLRNHQDFSLKRVLDCDKRASTSGSLAQGGEEDWGILKALWL
jgi:hypothetical protein